MLIGSPTNYACSVSPMIVCHFILNLRQIEPAGSSWASANQSHSLRFVGNMGQSLQFGDEDANGEEEDMPGVEGTSAEAGVSSWPEITTEAAEDMEVNEDYVGRNDDAEQVSPHLYPSHFKPGILQQWRENQADLSSYCLGAYTCRCLSDADRLSHRRRAGLGIGDNCEEVP